MSSHEFDPSTALRAVGESDRPADFKEARAKLVAAVNAWLQRLVEKKDAGEAAVAGQLTQESPRVDQTDLGPSGPVTRAVIESMKWGVSLTGDGRTAPIVFQWVKPGEKQATVETTDIQGSDPLASQFYGDEYSTPRQQETVVSFGVSESQPDPAMPDKYFRFTVMGDGRVKQQHRRDDGFNVSQELRTAADIEAANLAFQSIVGSIS